MPSVERQIDALGGASRGFADVGYDDGYRDALTEAMKIGSEADDLIDELLGCIDDVLRGRFNLGLERWAVDARMLHDRAERRRLA